jgi:PAS domain S-box-containing protein
MHYGICISILIIFIIPSVVYAPSTRSTILTAGRTNESILIDGYPNEDSWKTAKELVIRVQDGSIGIVDVSLKALYDSEYIYFFASWLDSTESVNKDMWTYNGENWTSSGNEDRIAFFWNIDDSVRGFNIAGCAMLCHGDRMHTNAPEETADLWQWKASRTNPLGYADDEWLDDTVVEGYDEKAKEAAMHGDGTSHLFYNEGYVRNINSEGTAPKYYEPDPESEEDARFIFQWEVESGEAVKITDSARFNVGALVPGYILKRPVGNRGDVDAKGVWRDGKWMVEFRRKLNTGYDSDVQFDISRTYRFGIAIMDNSGGFEAYGKGHSFDLGARTLEFGGVGSEEVTRLTLIKDYLTIAESHTKQNELEMAVANIGDAIIIYNEIGGEIASIDPELYLSTKKQFTQARRIPTLMGIASLKEAIDQTMLTFQGKRQPPEASLRLRFLVMWGKIQIYVLILLAFISLVPIAKAIKIGRKPTFRRLSIFILVIVIPLLFEGIGRIGILLKISPLQNLSFLTNEYATFQWALLMFFGLFIAKSGFEEVEESMRSMEHYSAVLKSDIEKMKRLQSELRRSEKRYRGLFEASPVGILEVDPEGKILSCNQVAAKIIHCPGEIKERSFMDFVVERKDRKEISAVLKEGGSIKDKLTRLKNPLGEEVIASVSLENILDEKGEVVRSEIAIMDVTERIRAEEEKSRLEWQLAQSEKLAAIGKLATGVAHEISNPLTNIQLAAEILSYEDLSDEVKARLDVITKNVDMASSVIKDLLSFSRMSQLSTAPLDLRKVLESSLALVSPRFKNIKVIKKMKKLPEINGDEERLREVFANIFINAAQAMPDGGVLKIETNTNRAFVVVKIRDTGHGISKEHLDRVFDPFFTTKEVGSGIGLGLSLCYGIVKAHGGDIDIESTLGKGTTVTVKLPREENGGGKSLKGEKSDSDKSRIKRRN